ncbi:MAG: S8 family peptidase [Bacillota bacterium]
MERRVWLLALAVVLCGMLAGSGWAVAAAAASAGGTAGGLAGEAGGHRYIVVFRPGLPAAEQVALARQHGGQVIHQLGLVNALAVEFPTAVPRALAGHPGVARVEVDARAFALARKPPAQPAQQVPWGVDRIDADLAWASSRGAGIKVGIVDTGIDKDHPDLLASVKGGYLAIQTGAYKNKGPDAWDDDNGHGTHVAGIVAAVDNTIGVVGVAPEAWLYGVKVLDRTGSGYYSDIIEGIQWCIDNGMQVINMSLGGSTDSPALHDAIITAYNREITVVCAAGNEGPGEDTVCYPARYPEVIAVAATAADDSVPDFSSRGPEVDIAAPGVSILSTWKGGGYATASGTSMASPHVAGTAALYLAARGPASPDQVRQHLMATAEPLPYPSTWVGAGLVDAQAAVSSR